MPRVILGIAVVSLIAGCNGSGGVPSHVDAKATAECFRGLSGYIEPDANGGYDVRSGIAVTGVDHITASEAIFPALAESEFIMVLWYPQKNPENSSQLQLWVTRNDRVAQKALAAEMANDRSGGSPAAELRRDEYRIHNAFFFWNRDGHTSAYDRQARGCLRG